MHEYPLVKRIIQIAEKHAVEKGADRVTKVNLVVGDYSGIVADCILLYFDIVSNGTICESSVLDIERVKPLLRCKKCGSHFERKPFNFNCNSERCDGEGEPTEIGREFFIQSIEVEYTH